MNGSLLDQDAIRLSNVSVRYQVPIEDIGTLKEYIIRALRGRRVRQREFWGLREVTLSIPRGETLGVIGRNGAGKSTLLKVVAHVIRPTSGRVWVRGRVAPLIELGAGFHPELTGRENVYLNGAILGFSRAEIDERFHRIVDFAELRDFIDAPLRTYSSGMMMRLGFATATDVDPDILLVDEILAVGDEAFQEKCLARMRTFRKRETTILFVSHDLTAISDTCDRAVWIHDGQVRQAGPVSELVESYKHYMHHPEALPRAP